MGSISCNWRACLDVDLLVHMMLKDLWGHLLLHLRLGLGECP